jgi:hypothetical protein
MAERRFSRGRCVNPGMDKRKVCVFLILVVVGILCLCVLAYTLFYAKPRSNSPIKNGGHSSVRRDAPPDICRLATEARLDGNISQRLFSASTLQTAVAQSTLALERSCS